MRTKPRFASQHVCGHCLFDYSTLTEYAPKILDARSNTALDEMQVEELTKLIREHLDGCEVKHGASILHASKTAARFTAATSTVDKTASKCKTGMVTRSSKAVLWDAANDRVIRPRRLLSDQIASDNQEQEDENVETSGDEQTDGEGGGQWDEASTVGVDADALWRQARATRLGREAVGKSFSFGADWMTKGCRQAGDPSDGEDK